MYRIYTKQFPAICSKHPTSKFWNKNDIARHRERYNCYEDVFGIRTKRYRLFIENSKGEKNLSIEAKPLKDSLKRDE